MYTYTVCIVLNDWYVNNKLQPKFFTTKSLQMHGKQTIRYECEMKRKIFSYNYFKCMFASMKIKIFIYILVILYAGHSEHAFAKEDAGANNKNVYLLSRSMKIGNEPVKDAIFSPDDQHAVVLSGSSSLEIYRTQSGKRERIITNREHNALSLVLHNAGKLAVTGGKDDTVRIWETDQTTAQAVLRGHLSAVSVLALNPGGSILASGSLDGTVIFWDIKEKKLLKSSKVTGKGSVKSLAFHPNGNILAIGGEDGSLQFRDITEMKLQFKLPRHKKAVTALDFNLKGDLFVSSSKDGKLIVWDWGARKQRFGIDIKDPITDVSIHPVRQEIAVATAGGSLETWSLSEGTQLHTINKFEHALISLGYDSHGQRIITGLEDGTVQIWEYGTSLYQKTFRGHERSVETLDFSNDSKYLISSSSDKTVRIWKVDSKNNSRIIEVGSHRVQDARFAPDSKSFATAGADSSVIIWNAEDGSRLNSLRYHKGKVNALSYHQVQPVLLSAGSDRQWVLWDLKSGETMQSRQAHTSQILAASISPEGNKFATAGGDFMVMLWKYPTGEPLAKLIGHKKPVTTLAFSPNGRLLASGGQDNQIFIWSIKPEISKTPLLNLEGHDFIVSQVMFSSDGKALISISKDKTMRLWEVKSGKMLRILHGDNTPLIASALSPDGKLIALSNLTNDISILNFPTGIPELENDSVTDGSSVEKDAVGTLVSESDQSSSEQALINLDDLDETEKRQMTAEELRAYSVAENTEVAKDHSEQQSQLNQLLKTKNTCGKAAEMENLALQILNSVPDDLAAYHALAKTSIMNQDFTALKLIVMAEVYSELDHNRYDYMPIMDIRNTFEKLRIEIFDQSYLRRGNRQNLNFQNCEGKTIEFELSDVSRNLRFPVEFLKKISSTPGLINYSELMKLPEREFQSRIFAEIDRILNTSAPKPSKQMSWSAEDKAKEVPFGTLNLNLEKSLALKNEGVVSFQLRKEGSHWHTYHTDQDNKVSLHLPAGRYYLHVAGILRKTFFMIAETQFKISIE